MNLRCMTPPNYFHMIALEEKSARIKEIARLIQSNQFDFNIDTYKVYEIGIQFFETEFMHVSERFIYVKSSSNTIDMVSRGTFKKVSTLKALRPKCILEVQGGEGPKSGTVFIGCWDSTVEIIKFQLITNGKGFE